MAHAPIISRLLPRSEGSGGQEGSPLFEVEMPNGLTYHLQETAFFSWFHNQVPSLGINGWYSSNGSFTRPADLCR